MRPLIAVMVAAPLLAAVLTGYAQLPPRSAATPATAAAPPQKPAVPPVTAGATAGLCQCIYGPQVPNTDPRKTHLHFRCLASVQQCKSDCSTPVLYSFVPAAAYTCPGRPVEHPGRAVSSGS